MAMESQGTDWIKAWKVAAGSSLGKEPVLHLAVTGGSGRDAEVKARSFFPELDKFTCEGVIEGIDVSEASWHVRDYDAVEKELEAARVS